MMNVADEYNQLAPEYDDRWAGYLKSTHDVALRMLQPAQKDLILDASGGTGLFAHRLLSYVGTNAKFTVLDISDKMLEMARTRLSNYNGVSTIWGDVHSMPFESGKFSKIVSLSAFHYYNKPDKVLSEFYRTLDDNGTLLIVDWCADSVHFKMFNYYMKLSSRAHHNIYSSEDLRKMLQYSGFEIHGMETWSYGLWSLMGIIAKKR